MYSLEHYKQQVVFCALGIQDEACAQRNVTWLAKSVGALCQVVRNWMEGPRAPHSQA